MKHIGGISKTCSVLVGLLLCTSSASATAVYPTTPVVETYTVENGWAPYNNPNMTYFYKQGSTFYIDAAKGNLFLDIIDDNPADSHARIRLRGTADGHFLRENGNGRLLVDPNRNRHLWNSKEGEYDFDLNFAVRKDGNTYTSKYGGLGGTMTNPLDSTRHLYLKYSSKHKYAFRVTVGDNNSIHGAAWFHIAGLHGDFFFDGGIPGVNPPPPGGGGEPVPEPASALLLGAGILGMARRRKQQQK